MVTQAILISASDAAVLLSMTRHRLLRLARAGKVPCVDAGDGELRFSPEALRAWVAGKQPTTEGSADAN